MAEAITLVEQTIGGKSTEAEFEMEDGKAIYEIEVTLADGSETEVEVEVDAQTGAILSQKVEGEDEKDDAPSDKKNNA